MSHERITIKGEGYLFEITRHDDCPGPGFLYLRYRADDQLLKEFADCDETIGQPKVTDGLRLELDCNRAATFEEIQAAVDAMVTRLNQRRGFVHAVYEPRWSLFDSKEVGTDFYLYIFPLNEEIVKQLQANPAVAKAYIRDRERGAIYVTLRWPFERDEVRGDLKKILRTFVGKKHKPKKDKES